MVLRTNITENKKKKQENPLAIVIEEEEIFYQKAMTKKFNFLYERPN